MSDSIDYNQLMRPRKVCLCRSVDKAMIEKAVREGATSLKAIQEQTLASTNCGTCLPQVMQIMHSSLDQLKAEKQNQKVLPFKQA